MDTHNTDMFENIENLAPPIQKTEVIQFEGLDEGYFKRLIPSIPTMTDHELEMAIKNNLDVIASDILEGDTIYAPLLVDYRFISCFIRVINSVPIDFQIKLACNKITYDYFTWNENKDVKIKQEYLNMSKVVNRDAIVHLIGIGLDENTASNLALCRYSTTNENTNAKRLNFTIYNKDPNVMTEQTIIWIYEELFDKVTDLFMAIMFETYTSAEFADFGDDFEQVYGTVGLAILTILNNMPSEKIRKILLSYSIEWEYAKRPITRFSLHALSGDFNRITRVIDLLAEAGHPIP